MKLNARQVETAKPKDKTYKITDGGGLYLEISPKGSKYWRMKYRRPGDKKKIGWLLAYGPQSNLLKPVLSVMKPKSC